MVWAPNSSLCLYLCPQNLPLLYRLWASEHEQNSALWACRYEKWLVDEWLCQTHQSSPQGNPIKWSRNTHACLTARNTLLEQSWHWLEMQCLQCSSIPSSVTSVHIQWSRPYGMTEHQAKSRFIIFQDVRKPNIILTNEKQECHPLEGDIFCYSFYPDLSCSAHFNLVT